MPPSAAAWVRGDWFEIWKPSGFLSRLQRLTDVGLFQIVHSAEPSEVLGAHVGLHGGAAGEFIVGVDGGKAKPDVEQAESATLSLIFFALHKSIPPFPFYAAIIIRMRCEIKDESW